MSPVALPEFPDSARRTKLPGAKDLLHLDPIEAADARWKWGADNLAAHEKTETTPSDFRVPLLEACEELWDALNYLREQARQDRISHVEDGHVVLAVGEIANLCAQLQRIARDRGY